MPPLEARVRQAEWRQLAYKRSVVVNVEAKGCVVDLDAKRVKIGAKVNDWPVGRPVSRRELSGIFCVSVRTMVPVFVCVCVCVCVGESDKERDAVVVEGSGVGCMCVLCVLCVCVRACVWPGGTGEQVRR